MEIMPLTIELPKVDVLFLEEYAKQYQLSISEFIYSLIEQFRASGKYVLHPEIHEILGLLPEDLDAKEAYARHIQEKHR
jgi:hypothetical protein